MQAAERERLRGAGREGSSSTTAIGGQAALEMVGVQLGGVTARGRVLGTMCLLGKEVKNCTVCFTETRKCVYISPR